MEIKTLRKADFTGVLYTCFKKNLYFSSTKPVRILFYSCDFSEIHPFMCYAIKSFQRNHCQVEEEYYYYYGQQLGIKTSVQIAYITFTYYFICKDHETTFCVLSNDYPSFFLN